MVIIFTIIFAVAEVVVVVITSSIHLTSHQHLVTIINIKGVPRGPRNPSSPDKTMVPNEDFYNKFEYAIRTFNGNIDPSILQYKKRLENMNLNELFKFDIYS